jgi:hypothetical protein
MGARHARPFSFASFDKSTGMLMTLIIRTAAAQAVAEQAQEFFTCATGDPS